MKFAIVVSKFNEEVTLGLLDGAKKFLASKKVKVEEKDIYFAPGSFEIPLLAKTLAKKKKYSGVIALGCVIKGDTAHFEFISLGTAIGLQQASLETNKPIAFGILTTYTDEQAAARSGKDSHNKGIEAASACWESAQLLARM
jgi:6,7-dimethyl-8-ribityllumazine synthase